MTQHQLIQTFLPILILLPVLYLRMRRMSGTRPLKLNRLWIQPAIILCLVIVALLAPQPHHVVRHLLASDWAWLAVAAGLGAVGGWYWGRTMKIDVHPEDGTLIVTGGQAAILVLVVLVLLRLGLRTGLEMEGKSMHLDVLLISDASIVFSAALFVVRAVEMYLRARRVMAAAPILS